MIVLNASKEDLIVQVVNSIEDFFEKNKDQKVVVGVPGGRSVQEIFKRLVDSSIDWSNTQFFFADERCVPLNSDESNGKQAKELLFDPLIAKGSLKDDQIHYFDGEKTTIENYRKELAKCEGKFDLLLLGVGEDGHVVSLFPNHESIKNDSESYVEVDNSPKPPPKRISVSKKQIESADTIILLFLGEGKREALKLFMDESVPEERCPAKIAKKSSAFVCIHRSTNHIGESNGSANR